MLKKIALAAGVLIFLIVGGLLVFGWMNPQVESETSVSIDKPRDVVWAYFSDPSKMGEWLQGFKKIETISGNPNEPGSKFRITFDDQGTEMIMIETNKGFRPPEFMAMNLDHEIMSNDVEVSLVERNGQTVLTQKEKIVGKNIIWRILFAAMRSSMQDRSEQALKNLKRNVEKL